KPTPSDLRQLLSDGLRFISKFYEIIERSALHTYYSALPFTPADSLLYRRYIVETLHRDCNVSGTPNQWDALIANLRHGNGVVDNIQFSLDSTMFVSWSDGMLKVWDAVTGAPISTELVTDLDWGSDGFAFSRDGSRIVSWQKESGVKLWDCADGQPTDGFPKRRIAAHRHHRCHIVTLAFSPDGRQFASGSNDGTINLWDGENG
ncbi:hypothetical protein M378DRAFT_43671, partial [Amanita muscaria Koide BX008]